MTEKLHKSLLGVLLTALCALGFGQPGTTTACADTLTSLAGKKVDDAVWEVSTAHLAQALTSYGVTVTPETLSLAEGEVWPLVGASCIEPYLFTNEIDSEKQIVYLNIYDPSLGKRVARVETFGLPKEGWIIGNIVAANLYAYFLRETSIVLSLETQQVLSNTAPSRDEGSEIFMVSGNKLLRERVTAFAGHFSRSVESLVIDGNSLNIVASCPVTSSGALDYILDEAGLKARPNAANSEPFQLIDACKNLAKTFPVPKN